MTEGGGVELVDVLLRLRRLRLSGIVMRKGLEEPLGKILELDVTGRRAPRRRKRAEGR